VKRSGDLARTRRRGKREQEAAERLTFLEKLVLRALPTRQVPAESGVQFAVSSKAKADGICMVFRVDDPEAPIVEDGPRPRKKIEEAHADGIEILPLGYHHQAELYPYVSKPVSRTERYKHERLPRETPELNEVERLLAEGRLARRVRDPFFVERRGGDEDTFFLSFRRGGDPDGAHVSVSATTRDAIVAFSASAAGTRKMVDAHLAKHGLTCRLLSTRLLAVTPA
jgi:hypothetical protein